VGKVFDQRRRAFRSLGILRQTSHRTIAEIIGPFRSQVHCALPLRQPRLAAATKGEWMWAMARSIEMASPLYIYAFVAPIKNKWQFDMHIENAGVESPSEPPCFGWDAPLIFVPVSEIFISVYNDCKKMLGIESATREGV
jgi:hypothetical protein